MSNQTDQLTTVLQTGDIVLAPFPFADHSITKLRPAILVSQLPHSGWLVIYITSADSATTPYDVPLSPDSTNNLKKPSVARANRMTVIAETMIVRHFGQLSPADKINIQSKLQSISADF